MTLVEHKGKRLLARAGIPIPRGQLVHLDGAGAVDPSTLRFPVVIKAQVTTGRRGKRGGVLVASNPAEVDAALNQLRGLTFDGEAVRQVLMEEHIGQHRAFYLSLMLDRNRQQFTLLASPQGGIDIEEAGATVEQWPISFLMGIPGYVKRQVAAHLGLAGQEANAIHALLDTIFDLTREWGLLLVEINPLALTPDGRLIALDAKILPDGKARIRWPEPLDDMENLTPFQQAILDLGIAGVELPDGDVAIITSGAGVGMATMDSVVHLGGTVRAFVDMGGISIREPVTSRAVIHMLQTVVRPRVFLFNFFFQLANSHIVAEAIADQFAGQNALVVARFRGKNEAEACATTSAVTPYVTTDFIEACQWAVNLSREAPNGHSSE